MLRRLLSLVAGLALATTTAQAAAGSADWANAYGFAWDITVAANPAPGGGNFMAGAFTSGTAPTIGTLPPLTRYATGTDNGLIVAQNAAGVPVWAVSLNSPESRVLSIAYANSKVYIAGMFKNTLTITPQPQLTGTAGAVSGFVVVMDATNGAFTAGYAIPGLTVSQGVFFAEVAANTNGDVAASFTWNGAVSVGGTTLTAGQNANGVIIKFTSALALSWYQELNATAAPNGAGCDGPTASDNYVLIRMGATGVASWMTSLFSTAGNSRIAELAIDPATNDVYAVGSFEGASGQLGTGSTTITATGAGDYTGVYFKVTGAGVPAFLKAITVGPNPAAPTGTRAVQITGVAFDAATASGWVVGDHSPGDVVFAGQALTPYNVNDNTIMLLRFATADGSQIWGANYASQGPAYTGYGYAYDLALNGTGMPIFVGSFDGSFAASPAPTLTNAGTTGLIVQAIPPPPTPPTPSGGLPLRLKSVSVKDRSPMYGNHRELAGIRGTKNATSIAMRKDSWSFAAIMNATDAPSTPADIDARGVAVALVTVNGTVLDTVAYNGTDCQGKARRGVLHRIDCRVKGRMGKLSFLYQAPKPRQASNNATYIVKGSWSKRALHGATAAAQVPLGVVIEVPQGATFSGMMSAGACKVAGNRRTVACKQ